MNSTAFFLNYEVISNLHLMTTIYVIRQPYVFKRITGKTQFMTARTEQTVVGFSITPETFST